MPSSQAFVWLHILDISYCMLAWSTAVSASRSLIDLPLFAVAIHLEPVNSSGTGERNGQPLKSLFNQEHHYGHVTLSRGQLDTTPWFVAWNSVQWHSEPSGRNFLKHELGHRRAGDYSTLWTENICLFYNELPSNPFPEFCWTDF